MHDLSLKGRIEYIDAMRGFTMLLVVLAHCGTYCMDQYDGNIYFRICQAFRMPLFFFVSGFVFYKQERQCWDGQKIRSFLNKKIPVQILSPLLFMLVYAYLNELNFIDGIKSPLKCGYWFTFTLFEFFLIYAITERIIYRLHAAKLCPPIIIHIIVALAFLLIAHERILDLIPYNGLVETLGIAQWHLYLYFIIGVIVRKYYTIYQTLLDRSYLVLISLLLFISLFLFEKYMNFPGGKYSSQVIKAITGIVIVLSFFRKHESKLSQNTKIGNILQFIGKRTLDIYLIHYFVLPKGLTPILSSIKDMNIPLIEFFIAAFLALVVVFVSLMISSVIRLSPTLAHYLFGQHK